MPYASALFDAWVWTIARISGTAFRASVGGRNYIVQYFDSTGLVQTANEEFALALVHRCL